MPRPIPPPTTHTHTHTSRTLTSLTLTDQNIEKKANKKVVKKGDKVQKRAKTHWFLIPIQV